MKYDLLLSIVFYVIGCIYVLIGAYIVITNFKSKINLIFLGILLCSSIWSFSFAVSNYAQTAEVSRFWRSIATFGWGIIYSLFLHFTLVFTKFEQKIPKRYTWLAYLIIYAPALINVLLFSPFGFPGIEHFVMEKVDIGWINTHKLNFWDIFYIAYYVIFSFASIVLLFIWYKNAKMSAFVRKMALVMIVSIIVPIVFGSITDTFFSLIGVKFPDIGVIFFIIPVIVFFISMKKYGLFLQLKQYRYNGIDGEVSDTLLSDTDRLLLFRVAGIVIIIGAFLASFLGYFVFRLPVQKSVYNGVIFFLCGVLLQLVPMLVRKNSNQNILFFMVCSALLAYIVQLFFNSGALTVWAVYLFFLEFAVLLEQQIIAFFFILFALLLQVFLWIKVPSVNVTIGYVDYLVRIFVIIISYVILRYVNNEYLFKLLGYKKLLQQQEVIEKISSNFISVNIKNARQKIDEMFEMCSVILDFNHAYLCEFSDDRKVATILNVCLKNNISPSFSYEYGMKLPITFFPLIEENIMQNQIVACNNIINMDYDSMGSQREYFTSRGVNSFIASPIVVYDTVVGMVVFEYYQKQEVTLNKSRLNIVQIIANKLGEIKKTTLSEAKLYNFAYFDPVTKLMNINSIKDKIKEIIEQRSYDEQFAVFKIGIGNIQEINDAFGYVIGNFVLQSVSNTLASLIDDRYLLGRTGDGEFAIVMLDYENKQQAELFAKTIVNTFFNPITANDKQEKLFVSVNVGISIFPENGTDDNALKKNASLALFESRNSPSSIEFFSDKMQDKIMQNIKIKNMAYHALEYNELYLEYQPQVDSVTKKIIGAETLLRWIPKGEKKISPEFFIPIFEQTGVINEVGLWVLKAAIQQHKKLIEHGLAPLRISVNVSPVQLLNEEIFLQVLEILAESKVDIRYIELEITESAALGEDVNILDKLNKLKFLGFLMALDDFGKKYSSLGRIASIPTDIIKIDKSFIDGIGISAKSEKMIKVIIMMAKELDNKVIAEGVETKEQYEFLKKLSCDQIQGYYFSKPVSGEKLEELLIKQNNGELWNEL